MSITRMRRKMGAGMKVILGFIIAIFVIMIPITFGVRSGMERSKEGASGLTKVVAVVNGDPISRETFVTAVAQVMESQGRRQTPDVSSLEPIRGSVLNNLIEERIVVQAARERGVGVSRRDVNRRIDELIDAQVQGYLQQFGKSADVSEYRNRLAAMYRAQEDRISGQMTAERLRQSIESAVRVTDKDLRESYDEVQVRHILIATKKPGGGEALSDAEARKKAEALLAKIKAHADLAALAKANSDDPGSAPRGGELDWFKRGRMVPEFEKVAFSLKPRETSGLVKTSYGYHIIRVEGRRSNLPKDFDKSKKKLLAALLTQRQGQAWAAFLQQQRDKAKITIPDPELRGARAYLEGNVDQALKDFQIALKQGDQLGEEVHAATLFTAGRLYAARQEWRKAADVLEKAVDIANTEMTPIYAELAHSYLQMGEKAKAAQYYQDAYDQDPQDPASLWALKDGFTRLGDKKRAAEMDKRLQEAMQEQLQQQMEQAGQGAPGPAPAR